MKKIIACIVFFVLLFTMQVSAEMQFKLSADADEVVGTGQELKANEIIKVIVLNEGIIDLDSAADVQNNLKYFNVLTPNEDGTPACVTIDFSSFTGNKIYKIFAIPTFTSNSDSVIQDFKNDYSEVGYAPLTDRNQYVQDIKTAMGESTAQVKTELEAKGIYLGIDYEMFKLSSSENVAGIMMADKGRLDLPALDIGTLAKFIDDSVLIDVLNGSNAGKITTEYVRDLICGDARYSDIKAVFQNTPSERHAYILPDISGKNITTYSGLKQLIINSVVINAFNYTNTNAENLYNILSTFKDATSPALNISALTGMGSAARATAVSKLSNAKHSSISDLQSAINLLKTDDGGGGAGGGAGGGGFAPVTGNNKVGLTPFSDMGAYTWAEEALYYLSQKNIISGYGNNTFKPENNITRAEFIKIIVSCFFDENSAYEMQFEDVAKEKWYSKYIAAALENKIVSGLSNTEFGPDRYITRQDMAVILYNTAQIIGFDMDTAEAEITDGEQISEYAKTAVYALKNSGVINGYEDGSFNPKSNANRAETVQMVYSFLIKKGELANEE